MQTKPSAPNKSVYKAKGGYAFAAPYTSFTFNVSALNDAGVDPGSIRGVGSASIDLIERTGKTERVVDTKQIYIEGPVRFYATLKQNTVYYARLNASPAHGIAAPVVSNTFVARAYLKHYPSAFHSAYRRTLTFSGFFSKVDGLPASNTVRVQIQRKTNKGYITVATLRPNAKREYKKVIRYGKVPQAYRVRVLAVGTTKRYVTVDEYKHCISRTKAHAAKVCKAVWLGVR